MHIGLVTAMTGLVRPMKHALVQAAEQDPAAFGRERACADVFFFCKQHTQKEKNYCAPFAFCVGVGLVRALWHLL